MPEKPEGKTPTPKSEDELVAYIRTMREWPESATEPGEGYGRCVYAMSNAAVAAFNYIASALGVTGFQASCADLDILNQLRGYKHGFIVLDGNNLLYPQYDIRAKVDEWIAETRPRLADEARKLLAESPNAHPNVVAHWQSLADEFSAARPAGA